VGTVGESIRGCMLEEGPVLLKLSFGGLMKCFVRVLLSGQWSASVKQFFFYCRSEREIKYINTLAGHRVLT
jgi:hypothetical protein